MGHAEAMGKLPTLPRPLLFGLAVLFSAAAILYSAIWMYYVRWESKAQIGIEAPYSVAARSMNVTRVPEGSAAQQAGLRVGDRIVAINGRRLDTRNPYYDAVLRGQPGDVVELTVERPSAAGPIFLEMVLQPRPAQVAEPPLAQAVANEVLGSYPVLFLVVGLSVLFLRLQDRHAWLLALLFGTFTAAAPLLPIVGSIHPTLRGFALAYKLTFSGLCAAIFYYFFAVFPVASPVDRRLPWLKSVLVVAAAVLVVPLGLWGLLTGSSVPLQVIAGQAGPKLINPLLIGYMLGVMGLGLVSLVWNSVRAPTAEARRKTRVIVWGTVVAIAPSLLLQAAVLYSKRPFYEFPYWVVAPAVLALFLLPLSFAYAVVKYRVMEIPVLVKRSVRYVLVQRGFVLLIFLSSAIATVLFAVALSRLSEAGAQVTIPAGLTAGVGLGVILAAAGARVHQRVSQRIDQAFFRSAYDARQILENLADKTHKTIRRGELAALLGGEISQALRPTSVIVYLEGSDGRLRVERDTVPPRFEPLPADLPLLKEVARRGEPWEVPPAAAAVKAGAEDLCVFGPNRPECLVPMQGRDGRLVGLVVLGPRLSEEPYSREDKRLLASVANHAGLALDSMRLAEQMAEKMEAERRAALEMEFAKQVQARLFPQRIAPVETLEYQGGCVQAREVGGDYYDFLNLGPGRVGLVLADVAGKGISAALMMANLQASLRSQYGAALKDLRGLLQTVNRLFYESTPPSHYATLFFGDYEDSGRLMRYANCGHNPPMLLRADGSVERLGATATVLGLFEGWDCSIGETQIAPGDALLIFSDGATEAESDEGEFFGESRLLETLAAHRHLPVVGLLDAIVWTVMQFSGGEQEDDITLLVARAR
jgi:sigma-B regulation protein RsbU (phosphoserine phosphatase)